MNVFGERCEEIVIDRDGRVMEVRFRSGETKVVCNREDPREPSHAISSPATRTLGKATL